jgi:deoxyribodipyrimidine photo-lyase
MMHDINEKRIRLLQKGADKKGPVVYWMSREQRVHDNWALLFAQNLALENNEPLIVLFCLLPEFLDAALRQYGFMLKGLKELEKELADYSIPFFLLDGEPGSVIPGFINKIKAGKLIADFDPLKIKRIWKRDVAKKINIPFYQVDAHNIVPSLYVSDKEEYGAYTIRPKIYKSLPEFLVEYPDVKKMKRYQSISNNKINWQNVYDSLKVDRKVEEVDWIKPGLTKPLKNLIIF